MKVENLIKILQTKDPMQDVLFKSDKDGVFSVESVREEIAEEDEYPPEWNMPEGYKFILLKN